MNGFNKKSYFCIEELLQIYQIFAILCPFGGKKKI